MVASTNSTHTTIENSSMYCSSNSVSVDRKFVYVRTHAVTHYNHANLELLH